MDFNNHNFLVDVNMSSELIKPFCLWAIVKFRKDNYHTQNNSSRGDLIGGFLDRWINKIPEYFIFDELLTKYDKTHYSIINDYFFYYAESAKNAPDVLGLKKEDADNVIIHKFATFDNDSWNIKKDAPLIEVKTFRQSQKLITIPKNQLEKNNPEDTPENMFYAIVYADDKLNKNYLLNLLDNNIFDIKPLFYYNSCFIESDNLNLLSFPDDSINEELIKINKDLSSEYIGSYHLAGIYKWDTIKDYAICVGVDNKDKPIKPFHLKSMSEVNNNIMEISGEFKYFSDSSDCIPFLIIMDKTSKCYLVSYEENSMILRVEGNVELLSINEDYNNKFSLDSGYHNIIFDSKIINLIKYYVLHDNIKLSSDFEEKDYLCELKSGIFNFYGYKFFNNIFDSKKYLDSDYKIINYSREKIYFSKGNKNCCLEFNKGFKKEPEIIESPTVKNILKEEMNDIIINLNISVDSNSCCKFISKDKSKFIVSVEGEGNVNISEEGDENEYQLGEGFHQFDINNNKHAPHIKNCIKNINLKNRDIKKEFQIHKGFYLPESKNQNSVNVKLKVDDLLNNSKIFIVKENKSKNSFSIDIIVNGKVMIDGNIIEDYSKNYERQWNLKFGKFDRTSKEEEYIISRDSLLSSNLDSSNELIELFDKIVDQNLFID